MIANPTKPRLSIRDVALLAKCAVGTASKVLNDSSTVSPAIKQRVLQAATDLGYIPNRHARNLKSGRTYRLGLLMPFASDMYYATLLDAFNETVMETEYRLDMQFHRWMDREEDKAIRYFLEAGMEGIIMLPCRTNSENTHGIQLLRQYRIPYVTLGMHVSQDTNRGMELLAEHLAALGHRQIALLLPAGRKMKERIVGAKKVLARYPGVRFEPILLKANEGVPSQQDFRKHGTSIAFFQDYIGKLVEKFLNRKGETTAAITANQMTAWLLIDALKTRGIRVPEDFSVVTLGLSNTGHFGGFSLTMAEYSPMEMAMNAMDILLKKTTQNVMVQPALVCRQSSGSVAHMIS